MDLKVALNKHNRNLGAQPASIERAPDTSENQSTAWRLRTSNGVKIQLCTVQ